MSRRRLSVNASALVACLIHATAIGCGSSGGGTTGAIDGAAEGGGADVVSAPDAVVSDGAGGDATLDGSPPDAGRPESGPSEPACPAGQAQCLGDGGAVSCVSLATDGANCGACGNACPASRPLCSSGTCGISCLGGSTLCGATCVQTNSDPLHCG